MDFESLYHSFWTFTVTGLAAKQTVVSNGEWASLTADARTAKDGTTAEPAWPLEIRNADGTVRGTITLPAGATLARAAAGVSHGPVTGAQQNGQSVSGGLDGAAPAGAAGGGGSADGDDGLLQRLRAEREQLGQLIPHPF